VDQGVNASNNNGQGLADGVLVLWVRNPRRPFFFTTGFFISDFLPNTNFFYENQQESKEWKLRERQRVAVCLAKHFSLPYLPTSLAATQEKLL